MVTHLPAYCGRDHLKRFCRDKDVKKFQIGKVCGREMLKKFYWKSGWDEVPNWECSCVHRQQGPVLSLHVDAIKFAGKKPNLDPMWKNLMKHVDLEERTSFIDHV